MRRVAITGMGIISPIGNDMETVCKALLEGRSGIVKMDDWKNVNGLNSLVAGVVDGIEPGKISRKHRRTMGRMAVMAALAAMDATSVADLSADDMVSLRTGVSMGSTTGSTGSIEDMFGDYLKTEGITLLEGTTFMKVMSHSVAANVAAMFGVKGRTLAPCSACASSTQAIGLGYEAIKDGYQDIMICGGADDLHPSTAGVFDILNAASRNYNDAPHKTPRPFDKNRDGLVVGEGAGVIVLEAYSRATARNATIHGEIIGYGTGCDGNHMTSPSPEGMFSCMKQAMDVSGINTADLDYINAHATGTLMGDVAETEAIRKLVGDTVPVSGTKGYTGHTLAASGVMEVIFCILMMQNRCIVPTLNLEETDETCKGICHVTQKIEKELNHIMTSNFAFGGINATLIIKRQKGGNYD
ncbi:MAG: beta-ketoacyl-[acyl-carrier-protein] synthase family protein [Desulfobacterales bacterium]|nr:beta-ketoacyl-[acyl-carrier-protein] synthase family protein [Desulfobacterales bacterium]